MQKTCNYCNGEFDTIRPTSKFCSSRCRTLAYRERHGIITKQDQRYVQCQREGCTNKIDTSKKANAKYCSNACRQKIYNDKTKEREKEKRDLKLKAKRDAKAVDDFIQELMGE